MTKYCIVLVLLTLAACSPDPEPTPDIDLLVATALTTKEQEAERTAPILAAPIDNALFDNIAEVKLAWSWIRPLAEDEVYDLRVWADGADHNGIARTQDTNFDLTQWLLDQKPGKFIGQWRFLRQMLPEIRVMNWLIFPLTTASL